MATESNAKPPPRPPATPGIIGTGRRYDRFQQSRLYSFGRTSWKWRRAILFGFGTSYALIRWTSSKAKAKKRDMIKDKTYLYWKIYDGGIVEAKSYGSNLNYLLSTSQTGSPEEPPRVMTLFDVIRTIKLIEQDDRIHGIIADFSNISVPSVPSYNLGLAQLEEIQDALLELRRIKHSRIGRENWQTVAWTDTFQSQGQYLFSTCFDRIYTQPSGEIPLVGMMSTIPFYGRLIKWLGIEIVAEARKEYKSFIQPYIDEKFTKEQKNNQVELINDLNDNLMTYIARNRFPTLSGIQGLNHVKELSQKGPYTASEAVQNGLLNGIAYRQDVINLILEQDQRGDSNREIKGFYHYAKVMERVVEKTVKDVMDIGVVYLMGTIGDSGEFGTAAVVRGLKEAGEDEEIGAVVLRIDTGGGGVVESDTIWAAVRDLREKYGKTVVASFGNASASGGYLVSTHADAILAAPSTITGSIGVAALRPTFLTSFFDRLHITLESIFTGSRSTDLTHKLTGEELDRYRTHVDLMYEDFKARVVEGRGVHPELIDSIAGGRVYAGIKAFELNAPRELIAKLRGLEVEDLSKITQVKDVVMGSPNEDIQTAKIESIQNASSKAAIVVLPEDQETSPFAVPVSEEEVDSTSLSSSKKDVGASNGHAPLPLGASPSDVHLENNAEKNAALALSTLSNAKPTPASTSSTAAGIYEINPGPFGRGLIDGIGGIRDSAIYACELFISNGISGYKLEHPELTDEQALRKLLPDAEPSYDETSGEMVMQMDVRLKRFPVQKSWWTQLNEATEKGDSMEVRLLPSYLKAVVAKWVIGLVAGEIVNELEGLGLTNRKGLGTSGLGLGKSNTSGRIKAEWSGMNLR